MTSTLEQEQRQKVVAEAMTWRGTPWRHAADVKGRNGGVDCGMLLIRSFKDSGVCPELLDPRPYKRLWFLHQDQDTYLAFLQKFSKEIDLPATGLQPGDIVAFKREKWKTFGHAGIVTTWPNIIHSYYENQMVSVTSLAQQTPLQDSIKKYFSYWG
jgi:cell wall-associated NlpC family hydrolase